MLCRNLYAGPLAQALNSHTWATPKVDMHVCTHRQIMHIKQSHVSGRDNTSHFTKGRLVVVVERYLRLTSK